MKLPKQLLASHFEISFQRGTIIKFLMTDPDDPAIKSRPKYALIVGRDCSESESFLLLTTSKLDKLEPFRKRLPEGFYDFAVGSYAWVTMPTTLDLRKVRTYPREELINKMNDGVLRFECQLSEDEMSEIDAKLRTSKTIEVRTLRRIVSAVS